MGLRQYPTGSRPSIWPSEAGTDDEASHQLAFAADTAAAGSFVIVNPLILPAGQSYRVQVVPGQASPAALGRYESDEITTLPELAGP